MKMKNLIIILFLVSTGICAQRSNGGHEKIKALKTAHITQALDLTPAEAEKFWPIYNQYNEKMDDIRRKERQEIIAVVRSEMSSLNDAEANELIDKMLDFKTQELEHQKALVEELRKVLPPQKILKLRKAEDDFRRMLVHKLKTRHKKTKN